MRAKDDAERALLGKLPEDPEEGTVGVVRTGAGLVDAARAEAPLGWLEPDLEWLCRPPPDREWLVRTAGGVGFLPRGEVGLLAAPGSSGKTWVLVALALALATGRSWLGMSTHARAGRVALVLAEETSDELRRRVQAQAALMEIDPAELIGRLRILTRESVPGPLLLGAEGAHAPSPFGRRLQADLEAWAAWGAAEGAAGAGIDLVILDPLTGFGAPDCEVDNNAATATMRAVEQLTRLPGAPAVLVAHHTRKQNAAERKKGEPMDIDDVRGASGLVNRARWAAVLSPVAAPWEGVRISRMDVLKANYCPPLQPVLLGHFHGGRGAVRACMPDELRQIPGSEPRKPDVPATYRAIVLSGVPDAPDTPGDSDGASGTPDGAPGAPDAPDAPDAPHVGAPHADAISPEVAPVKAPPQAAPSPQAATPPPQVAAPPSQVAAPPQVAAPLQVAPAPQAAPSPQAAAPPAEPDAPIRRARPV